MVKIQWAEEAIKDLEKLDKVIARRVLKKIIWFSNNFKQLVPEPLSSEFKETYKLRVGDWRVLHRVKDQWKVKLS